MTTATKPKYDEARADRGGRALDAASERCEEYEPIVLSGDETFMEDLLTDLRHLCARDGYDFTRIVAMSEVHFNAEAQ